MNRPRTRRRFLKGGMLVAGIASAGTGLWSPAVFAADRERDHDDDDGTITRGDIAILRFLAAAELIETDLWQQYAELAGEDALESGYRSAIEVLTQPGSTPFEATPNGPASCATALPSVARPARSYVVLW